MSAKQIEIKIAQVPRRWSAAWSGQPLHRHATKPWGDSDFAALHHDIYSIEDPPS